MPKSNVLPSSWVYVKVGSVAELSTSFGVRSSVLTSICCLSESLGGTLLKDAV